MSDFHDDELEARPVTPFFDPMLEDAILGACILDDDCWNLVASRVTADQFWQPDNRLCWQAVAAIRNLGEVCYSARVLRELGSRAPGQARMAQICERASSAYIIESEAAELQRLAAARTALHRARSTLDKALTTDATDFITALDTCTDGLEVTAGRQLQTAWELSRDLVANLDRPESDVVTMTGIAVFDAATGGLPNGVTVIAGRPGMGKSALAHQVMLAVAKRRVGNVLYFSIETDNRETWKRIVSAEAGLSYTRVFRNRLDDDERGCLMDAAAAMADLPIHMLDIASLTPSRIRAEAVKAQAHGGLALIVADYIQSIKPDRREREKRAEVSAVALALRDMARDLQVPVIGVAQLNRESELKKRRPCMADLAESGDLEQSAGVVVFPFRPIKFQMNDEHGVPYADNYAEYIIGKNRNGTDGTLQTTWNGGLVRFEA